VQCSDSVTDCHVGLQEDSLRDAVKKGRTEIVKALLEAKADVKTVVCHTITVIADFVFVRSQI
jgi:hypothetical protein